MNDETEATMEAIQNVVNHVAAYQDGAPEGTIETELRTGLSQAGVDVADEDVRELAAAIEATHGSVSATEVLGSER